MKLHVRCFASLLLCVLVLCSLLLPAASAIEYPDINATACLLVDPDTGLVLYEKNSHEKRYPASTTKIMTALLTLEKCGDDLDQTFDIIEDDFTGVASDASKAGFKVGETVTIRSLLYGLMLPSGNEAANVLARFVSGSIPDFVAKMNSRASELGCTGTHFANPNGLHDPDHYTTAYDLFLITRQAMKNETFCDIVSTAQKTLPATNLQGERKIYSTNMMIFNRYYDCFYQYCKGVKTGYTSDAGYCLVAAANYKNSPLISVMLGCERGTHKFYDTFYQTGDLFRWAYENFTAKTLVSEKDQVKSIGVRLSTQSDKLVLIAKDTIRSTVPVDLEPEQVERTIDVPDVVSAPIKAGEKIGTMTLSYNGTVYGTTDLVALNDISLSEVLYYADKLENFFQSPIFRIALLVLVVLLILYIFLFIVRERNRRIRQRRKEMMRRRRMEQQEEEFRRENRRR